MACPAEDKTSSTAAPTRGNTPSYPYEEKEKASLDEYLGEFSCEKKKKKAFKIALAMRNFEIELYWKRAAYFWVLVGALFVAYGVTSKGNLFSTLAISCLGFLASLAWRLVGEGSKFWQENWEKQVDIFEEFALGKGRLFKSTIELKERKKKGKSVYKRYSVTKIDHTVSLYVCIFWVLLFVQSALDVIYYNGAVDDFIKKHLAVIVILFFVGASIVGAFFLFKSRPKVKDSKIRISLRRIPECESAKDGATSPSTNQ
ncbi:MAG: hypothetical protein FWF41_01875 [Betaproteobacteria bacterium]|nr:hypothetical protein [Betaproteobacteria bacterium]